jgi:hypothetical protein
MTGWDNGTVWYAAYGSNLAAERVRCYLRGGCPPGATRTYPGARDPSDPLDARPFVMPGGVAFAWKSPTWGGGIAFYDAGASGVVLARAYLLTAPQFADVLEQEMWRTPGADVDLGAVLRDGRHVVGPGRYETLHLVGELDGRPVVTFTAPDVDALGVRPPADAYVRTLARGLHEAHGLAPTAAADYLAGCRGIGRSQPELATLLGAPG